MNLTVRRQILTKKSIIGELFIDGSHECWTLEPPVRVFKPRAIPSGHYQITLRHSMRFARLMPHVENVFGFDGILIHPGNGPEDTHGCLLVADRKGLAPDQILDSHIAFDALFRTLQLAVVGGVPIWIDYIDVQVPEKVTEAVQA